MASVAEILHNSSRRNLIGAALGIPVAGLLSAPLDAQYPDYDATSRANRIVADIKSPRIPRRDFHVTAFGGRGDGKTDDSVAIARAIAACTQAGGGRIILPTGTVLSGPIRLKSRMELHVPAGGRLKFITNPARYLPPVYTRWEGVELMGYHPLIYAFEETDIAITGAGVIDGGADEHHWWPWKGLKKQGDLSASAHQAADRARLFEMGERGVPVEQRVFGEGNRLRPSLFQPYRCERVLVEGLTITASPFWLLHPVLCRDVIFRSVTCSSHGPNNDGIDPESCVNVLIDHCIFDTGDDCIAIKAGRNADGRRIARATENVVIRHCEMRDGHAGVAIGSELTGGVRNVFVQDCRMSSPNLTRALFVKTNAYRGGIVENIHVERLSVGVVELAFLQLDMLYEEGEGGSNIPVIRNYSVRGSHVERTNRTLIVRGREDSPISGVALSNIRVTQELKPSIVSSARDIILNRITVNGKQWTQAELARLPGFDTIECSQWANCK